MKIRNSLKSLKDRHRDNRVIRRRDLRVVLHLSAPVADSAVRRRSGRHVEVAVVCAGAKSVLDPLWATRLRGGMAHLTACVPSWSLSEIEQHLHAPSYLDPATDEPAQQKLAEQPPEAAELQLSDYVDRVDLQPVTHIGPLTIERRFTHHHIPTTAIRVSLTGQKRPLFAYSADTAFDPDLIAWLHEAALIVHETNFGIHTPLASLLQLPEEIRSKLRLIHYPDMLDPNTAPLECLREGTILDLG